MRLSISFILLLSAILLSDCKKKGSGDPEPTSDSTTVMDAAFMLRTVEEKYVELGKQTNGSLEEVLILTHDWLKTQPEVKDIVLNDELGLQFQMQSGIILYFRINIVDDNGISEFRGGGNGDGKLKTTGNSTHEIMNKKVLLFYAEPEFYNAGEMQRIQNHFINSKTKFNVITKKGTECTPQLVETFGEYGLVIINTHGEKEGFLTGVSLKFDEKLDTTEALVRNSVEATVGPGGYGKLQSDHLRICALVESRRQVNWNDLLERSDLKIYVTSTFIGGLPLLPSTIVVGNMCYSGTTKEVRPGRVSIKTAMLSRAPICYYSYSYGTEGDSWKVTNILAKKMEDSIVRALVIDFDSTGVAHLKANGQEFMDTVHKDVKHPTNFKHDGAVDYSYDDCMDSLIDGRDQQVYKVVCIGEQTWMAENLNYNTAGSFCYDNNNGNCDIYGRLYSWPAAMAGASSSTANPSGVRGVCPADWHLPSYAEWQKLSGELGGASVSGGALKSMGLWEVPNIGATNSSGFTAVPGGVYMVYVGNPAQFNSIGRAGDFWSATLLTADRARAIYLTNDNKALTYGASYISEAHFSVRCVKD